ncbi:NAD dependent epimerase/dehydratase [Cylindrobasidium torrendii FP15055 ss-10]|uniref:NAD dependent epimerase/dehydratase n=1 Tax=Cylindrobasidium torrendii FP15055 ss-10 TaxID=1314674 RepID=A0A0D7BJR3_9AGAR|nr:NAD dependent epimerase/dehydratase [Cylindrobasidium torrendii FP15055 ss-10]
MPQKVIITGASGVLGTAVKNAFSKGDFDVLGLSFTQTGPGLRPLNLLDQTETEKVFTEFKPDWVIHCAAERRPDVAEKNPDGTRELNVKVPAHLASLSQSQGFKLVYISTDYVFDGTSPPYAPDAPTNPLNGYGITKRDGEQAVLSASGSKSIVLRVPVLYGPAPKNADSAVNILLDVVQDQSGKTYKMDHYATRFPTNVIDIGNFLVRLTGVKTAIPSVLHYSAAEPFTKYEMCLVFAKVLGLPHGHIIADDAEPAPGSTPRPKNTQLDTRGTEALGVEGGLGLSLFEEWWTEYLKK